MTALPAELRRDIRASLRKNAGRWIARFYRHELLVARSVRGMQIEARQEFNRELVHPLLREIGGRLANFDLRGNDIVLEAYPELVAMEREMQGIIHRGSDAVRRLTTERLDEMTRQESEWVAYVAKKELDIDDPPQPTIADEHRSVDQPFLGAKADRWFQDMLEGPTGSKVRAWVQTGLQRGLTTDEIVRGLKGTRTQAGILEAPGHAVAALVRTAATSASSQQRMQSFDALGVTEWRFVATLDHRTSKQCAVNDGLVFKLGEGPVPPLHPNCRSTAVPYFGGDSVGTRASQDGQVPADTTFAQWIETQPRAAQDQVLGKTVAQAWRSGKLTLQQTLGRDLEPLTLAELRELDRL